MIPRLQPGLQEGPPSGSTRSTSEGNACYFFNPFDSAIKVSRASHLAITATNGDVGFVGENDAFGRGHAIEAPARRSARPAATRDMRLGMGLEKTRPGCSSGCSSNVTSGRNPDTILLQTILNGEVSKYQLPGGAIDWDVGAQYTYENRDAFTNDISNQNINPCPFLRQTVTGYTAIDNIINATSTCPNPFGGGVFSVVNASSTTGLTTGFNAGPVGGGFQDSEKRSLFSEFQLPVLKRTSISTSRRGTRNTRTRTRQSVSRRRHLRNRRQVAGLRQCRLYGQHRSDLRCADPAASWLYDHLRDGDEHDVELLHGRGAGQYQPGQPIDHLRQYGSWPGTRPELECRGALHDARSCDLRASSRSTVTVSKARHFSGITKNAIAQVLTKNTVRGSNLDDTVVISCADPTLQAFFNQGAAGGLFGGQPFVEFTDGTNFYHCGDNSATGGPNITTFTIDGVDVDGNGSVLDSTDLGLAINNPNEINAGYSVRSGVEFTGSHRLKPMVFGGVLSTNVDLSWNVENYATPIFAYGSFISAGTFNIGTRNVGFSNDAEVWSGSIGFNYSHGKQNLNMSARWLGPVIDASGLGLYEAAVPGSEAQANYNPVNTAACDTAASGLGIPFLPDPQSNGAVQALVGDILVGEQNYDPNCNPSSLRGFKINGQVDISATYQIDLPADTTLTVSVDNLLGSNPAYERYESNYDTFGSLSIEGRTVKVGLLKKF